VSGEEGLTDLLRTASGALGDDLSIDPRALIVRARRKRRRHLALGAVAMVVAALLGASVIPSMLGGDDRVDLAAGDPVSGAPPGRAGPPPPGWTRLPDPPLSPRTGASVVSTGNEVVVLGGSTQPCAAGEGCVPDPKLELTDGAAFSLTTRTWRQIAPPPSLFRHSEATAIGGDVFLLPRCTPPGAGCDSLVRYRPADDAWDLLPLPHLDANSSMSRLGGDLVIIGDPEGRAPVIWRLEIATTTWTKLPTDPLPPDAARVLDADGDRLLLFAFEARRGLNPSNRVLAARLEVATGEWSVLPPPPGSGLGRGCRCCRR
jgi:hypothetical protein